MILNIFLWNIFMMPIICTTNVAVNKTDYEVNKTFNAKKIPTEVVNNHSQMVSEGSILHEVPTIILPKSNITKELLELESDTGKTREKPIHARKGVGNPVNATVIESHSSTSNDNKIKSNDSIKEKFEAAIKNYKSTTVSPPAVIVNNTLAQDYGKTPNTTKNETPKKPLKVTYEALAELERKFNNATKLPFVKSSSKTIVNDQMPSPNKETYIKTYSMASKHPGMVTPIVITILVVPMFAVLGYMALKRGREAWKNRHYKRMDFLLDGMYND